MNHEDSNSTTEVDIERVTDNDVCVEHNKDPSTSNVSVEVRLEKLSSKEAIQEVEDLTHDVTLSSTSSEFEAGNSSDSSFSKFKLF